MGLFFNVYTTNFVANPFYNNAALMEEMADDELDFCQCKWQFRAVVDLQYAVHYIGVHMSLGITKLTNRGIGY